MGFKYGNLEGTRKPFHIGTGPQDGSAQLQADATDKGFLPPRMTTAQRAAIAIPAEGLLVFDTDFDEYYVFKSASWKQLSGVHVGDLAYYVDGTSGSDANGGTGWGDAKQTFTFIRETSKEVPRVIIGNLTLNVRGVVCSTDNVHNLNLKSFVVSGGIYVTGEMTDVHTGLAVVGCENTTSVISHHSYITTPGEGWVAGDFKGFYVIITAGTGAGSTYYPILDNTDERLELIGLPDLSVTSVYSIVSPSEIRGALVADPSTLIAYVDEFVEEQDNNAAYLRFSKLLITANDALTPSNNIRIGSRSSISQTDWYNCSINSTLQQVESGGHYLHFCWVSLDNYRLLTSSGGSVGCGALTISNSVFYASGTTGGGLKYYMTPLTAYTCRFKGQDLAIGYYGATYVELYDLFFDSCNIGLSVSCSSVYVDGQSRFKDTLTAISVLGGQLVSADSATYLTDTVTTEISLGGGETYDFTDIGTKNISNAAMGSSVVVFNWTTGLVDHVEEYDGTASGLVATKYQTAIDELAAIQAAEAIIAPLTMYVDGTTGNDANDGLSWGTAKQTFGFLMAGEPDALPREINAAVIINWRNDVRARSADGHLIFDGFYGSGSITVSGTLTAVETFTATGYENDRTVRDSRNWVSDATKAWTPGQWRRHFVNLGHTYYYPIRDNDATTLWMGFGDDQSGSYAATIYSAPELLSELVTNPGVKYDLDFYKFVYVNNCNLSITINKMWIDEYDRFSSHFIKSKEVLLQYVSGTGPTFSAMRYFGLDQCYINLTNYSILGVYSSVGTSGNLAVDSTDSTGYGIYVLMNSYFNVIESWIGNQLFACEAGPSGTITFNRENYIQDCDVGLFLEGGLIMFATPITDQPQLRFDTVNKAIVGMGDIVRQAEFGILGWDVVKEFVFSDTDEGSFADFTAATLQSRQQLRLSYSDASYLPILNDEYDNTTSGLTATRYQTAIDELANRVIVANETYYVDGDAGDDAADGLAWGTAKKTFAFLRTYYGEVRPLVTFRVYARGTVLSADDVGHLQIKYFTGAGTVEIIGEPTVLVSTLTPTAYQNTSTVWDYHAYVDVSGAGWTVNEYQGRYIKVSGDTNYYPILSNTTERLWSTDLPDMSGATRFDIVDMTIIRPATVAAPGVPVDYSDDFIEVQDTSIANVLIQNFRIEREGVASPQIWLMDRYYGDRVTCRNVSFESLVSLLNASNATMLLDRCYVDIRDYGFIGSGNTTIMGCCLFGYDGGLYESYGVYSNRGSTTAISNSHFVGMWYGLEGAGRFLGIDDVLFRDCLYGVFVQEGAVLSTGSFGGGTAARFKDCGTCIAIQQGTYQVLKSWNNWVVDNCTTQLWLADDNTALFSEIGTRAISNASTSSSVVEYDYDVAYEPTSVSEYDNSTSLLAATRFQTAIDEMQVHHRLIETDMKEPTGFPFNDQFLYSTISFDNGLRRCTIEPAFPPFSSFHFWVQGTSFTKTTAQTADIPDTEGLHGIYFDTDGVLKVATNPNTVVYGQLQREKALVAWVYWDADNNQQIYFSNERHGMVMDGLTHESFHWRFGMYLNLGGNLTSVLSDESGALASHAQFGTDFTMSVDEDVTHFSNPIASTTGLPIYYRSGATGLWRRELNAGFSVLTTGTGRLAWNQFTGGSWGKTEVTDDHFVLCHVFTTNDTLYKFFAVMGQAEYDTLAAARAAAATEMNGFLTAALPQQEWFACGTVIFQTNDTYGNAVKARVRQTVEGDDYLSWLSRKITPRSAAIALHNDLDGLNLGDYKHLVSADLTQLTTNTQATNHYHIPTIQRRLTVGQVGSQCDYTPTLGFGAITASVAAANVIGYSVANPMRIDVYPGTYIEPAEIVVNAGLFIVCSDARADMVFVVAMDPTKDLFQLNGGSLHGLHLIGVGTPGKALVKCSTPGTLSILQSVAINGCYAGVIVEAGAAALCLELGMIVGAPGMSIGVGVIATGVGTFVGLQGCFATVPAAILPAYAPANPMYRAVEANDHAEVLISTGSFRIATQAPNSGDVMFADDGAILTLAGVDISNSDVAMHIGSTGTGTVINALAGFQGGNNLNIVCESATGIVYTAQSVDSTKQFLVSGAKLVGILQLRDDELTALMGTIRYQYLSSGRQVDFADFFADYTSTGVCEGGDVTAATGLHVDVAAGDGWVRRGSPNDDSKWVEWVLTEDIDLTASNTNYIYVDGADGIVKKTLTPISYGDSILLATIVTDGSGIRFLHKTRNYLTAPMEQLKTYLLATRKLMLNTGLTFVQGTGVRNIDVGAGSYYCGLDLISYGGDDDATWSYFYGAGGATEVPSITEVNITDYDLGGALTDMQAGWWRADTLVLTSDGRLSLIYGTLEYATQPEAEAALQANLPTFMEITAFPLCNVIIEEGVGIASFVDLRAQGGASGGGAGGVSDHGLLAGLPDDDHPQYLLADGFRSMGGDLNMGTNDISNVGTVDGVDVSGHVSRHLFGGADALSTGTPSSIGTANTAGSSTSIPHLDHVHDHGSQSTATHHAVASALANGFMSSAHFTKVDTGIPDYAQYVTVAKSGGDYTDPATALAAIVDATSSKRYALQIFPGEYTTALTLKDYVDIIGVGPPRSVVLQSSADTVITMSNANRSDLRNLRLLRTSTTNGDHCIAMTAGTHLIYDCVVEQVSTDAYGVLISLSGTGTLQLNTGQYTLTQTGTSTGAGNNNHIILSEGATELLARGINCELNLEDADDNAIVFLETSAASGTVDWQASFIEVNVSATTYSGIAGAFEHRSTVTDKYLASSRINVYKSAGSATGTGKAYICNSTAGGAYFRSAHNVISVSGFASNYFADIDTGDDLLTEFDSIVAESGAIGAGDIAVEGRTKYLHGVDARSTVVGLNCLPTHITTTTFTLGATANPIRYYYKGITCLVSVNKTATLDDGAGGSTAGIYWVYFNRTTGTILATKAFPGISFTSNVLIAAVVWNGSNYGLVSDERHGAIRDTSWHSWAHQTVGVRYRSGFDFVPTGTGLGATFTMSSGELWDEDINYTSLASASWPTPHALRTWYQTGASTYVFDSAVSTVPFRAGAAGRPTYVNLTGYALTEASSAVNRFFNFFIYGTADMHTPVYCFAETVTSTVATNNGYNNAMAARAIPFPALSAFNLSPELKPLYRLIVRADGVVQAITSADDYRLVSSLPLSAGITGTTASSVSFTPAGDIASSNVQLALEELDAEKAALSAIPAFEASTANILMDGTVSVGDTTVVPRSNHRHPTDTTRLTATRGNWKAFHSDGSGVFQEIALGAAGTVLKGNGVAAAPSFGAVGAVFPVFNVKDYGAIGNGIADDTTAIRNTLTAVGASGERGSTVYFPGGIYMTTGTITVNDNALTFCGPGMGGAMINPTSTNIPVFQLTAGNQFITFRDLEFGTLTTQVAGSSFIDTNGANDTLIDRVNMFGWFYGIYIRGGSNRVTVSNTHIKDGIATTGVGIYIDNSTSTDVNIGPWVMMTNGTGAKPLAGILVKACGGFSLNNVTVNNTTHGLQLYPSSGALVQYGRITDCVFDLTGTNGAYIYTPNQASPGQVRSIKFIGCLFSNANAAGIGYGVTLEGASNGVMDDVSFDSCRIVGNGRHGINYLFGSNIRVNGTTIAGNSASASNTYDGISIAAALSDFEILNNRIGQSGPAANTQRYAVNIAAGASNRYQIVGNDVGTNNTAPYILDGGTGVFKRILQNGNAMPISSMPALSAAVQSLSVAANVLTGSVISLPVNSLLVGTRFCWEIVLTKTAAGTATWALQVKFGTAGTTADAAIASWTSGTNTAAIDQCRLRVVCDILTLGASATARCNAFYCQTLTSVTGLGRINGAPTSTATFSSASSPAFIHIGVTPGASAVMTSMCEAQIIGAG